MYKMTLVFAIVLGSAAPALAQGPVSDIHYPRIAVRAGERCIVCQGPLDSTNGFVLLVKGRRVALDSLHRGAFMKSQQQYLATLQPNGALFTESFNAREGTVLGGVTTGWFLAGLYVLIALLFAGLSGYAAVGKGLKPLQSFFVGFVFSGFGYLYVLAQPSVVRTGAVPPGLVKVPVTANSIPCEKCGTRNHPSAHQCAGCGAVLRPQIESEVARAK